MTTPHSHMYRPHRKGSETDGVYQAYDNFVSLLAQYQREEITKVAQIVEQKLEALLAAVTEVEMGSQRHDLAEERRVER